MREYGASMTTQRLERGSTTSATRAAACTKNKRAFEIEVLRPSEIRDRCAVDVPVGLPLMHTTQILWQGCYRLFRGRSTGISPAVEVFVSIGRMGA